MIPILTDSRMTTVAIALMFGIARTLLRIGYQPEKTIVFCCMAAEEWGIENSKYDWSTGAWQQVFKIRPEWQGKVIADRILSFRPMRIIRGMRSGLPMNMRIF